MLKTAPNRPGANTAASGLFAELTRRRVVRSLIGYAGISFAVLQIIEPVMHGLHWPEAVLTFVVIALALGFPLVIALAWAFDLKHGRIERSAPAALPALQGSRLAVLIAVLGLAAAAPGIVWYIVWPNHVGGMGSRPGVAGASLAVLPFTNLGADTGNAWFADGVHETILSELARVKQLKVISRTSVLQYRDTKRGLKEIGAALGVGAILEGSVQRAGNRVRVTVGLVDVRSDANIWSETFDRSLDDVFAIQTAIASHVAAALAATLTPSEQRAVERQPTTSREAWDLYLRAKASDDDKPAERLYRQAIEIDPSFALAMAQLSILVNYQVWNNEVEPGRYQEVLALANRAIALQPDLPEGHLALGYYLRHVNYDYAGAEKQFRLALQLAPGCAECIMHLGWVQQRQGRWEESLASFVRASELDPRNDEIWHGRTLTLGRLRRYREAADVAGQWMRVSARPEHAEQRRGWFEFLLTGDETSLQAALAKSPELETSWDRYNQAMYCRRHPQALAIASSTSLEMWENASTALLRGEALRAMGEPGRAKIELTKARAVYAKLAGERAGTAFYLVTLARLDAFLGNAELARSEAAQAAELLPEAKDASGGVEVARWRVLTLIDLGERDAALAEIERLVNVPHGFEWPDLQRAWFDPLRSNPRFQHVMASLRPADIAGSTLSEFPKCAR